MAWVGSACTSACGIVVGRGEWGGGLLCCVFFNAVVKGGLEFVLMFVFSLFTGFRNTNLK